ncbi:MAG: uracil-xanthine permease [Victivallales bacterium]|nr:uracil-xanthine permease [Victivallales bacterium]
MAKLETKDFALGIQHLLAMFGATVLVPLITGLSPAVALLTAGLGTLLFHLCTKGMVPVFLGSSFAFIPALCAVIGGDASKIPLAQGGVIVAGLLYVIFAILTKVIGSDIIRKIFPPVVTGPVIIIIGLSLTGPAIKDVFDLWGGDIAATGVTTTHLCNAAIAIFTFAIMAIGMNRSKGFWKLIPILIAVLCGYALCVILHFCGLYKMNFAAIANAPWINIPYKTPGFLSLPKFAITPILTIAPVAIVTFMEHLGDITTNGAVVGKDFFKEPGLHRTLLGDGLATALAGFFGGPSNTTYSENTGVLATTGNYNPAVLRLAAVFAIILAFLGKFGAFLQTIPVPVKGGVELMLFGMIAAIGIRTIVEAKLDMTHNRNLCIMAATLCSGIGLVIIGGLPLKIGGVDVNLSALFIATIIGVLMNLVIPEKKN